MNALIHGVLSILFKKWPKDVYNDMGITIFVTPDAIAKVKRCSKKSLVNITATDADNDSGETTELNKINGLGNQPKSE
ncbi:hypothetical protein ACWWJF_20155 [Symbiopectobacterium sp. Eva_TO]